MSVSRDTSADEAAELTARAIPGAGDPPLTLSGPERAIVHAAMRDTYALLQSLEGRTKEFRVRQRLRTQRMQLGRALAYVPAAPGLALSTPARSGSTGP